MEFLSLSRRRSSGRNVPGSEELGETAVFSGYDNSNLRGIKNVWWGSQGKSHAHYTSGVIWHFWTWTCTTFNNISIILNLLTKLWTKTKGLCTVRELPTKTTAPLFSTFMFAGFPNKSPLITMNSTINCTPINHPSAPNVGNLYNLKVGTFALADHEN